MNRADRRRLKRTAAKAIKRATSMRPAGLTHEVPTDSVRLEGGPMDGWIVKAEAPALRPDWCLSWPPSLSAKWKPGVYHRSGRVARWSEL